MDSAGRRPRDCCWAEYVDWMLALWNETGILVGNLFGKWQYKNALLFGKQTVDISARLNWLRIVPSCGIWQWRSWTLGFYYLVVRYVRKERLVVDNGLTVSCDTKWTWCATLMEVAHFCLFHRIFNKTSGMSMLQRTVPALTGQGWLTITRFWT
jgi:hypothetical protein